MAGVLRVMAWGCRVLVFAHHRGRVCLGMPADCPAGAGRAFLDTFPELRKPEKGECPPLRPCSARWHWHQVPYCHLSCQAGADISLGCCSQHKLWLQTCPRLAAGFLAPGASVAHLT